MERDWYSLVGYLNETTVDYRGEKRNALVLSLSFARLALPLGRSARIPAFLYGSLYALNRKNGFAKVTKPFTKTKLAKLYRVLGLEAKNPEDLSRVVELLSGEPEIPEPPLYPWEVLLEEIERDLF